MRPISGPWSAPRTARVTRRTTWCGRRTGPGSRTTGARMGLGLLDRCGERRAHLARAPARGYGGHQRHRLVAGWRAPGDLVLDASYIASPQGGARACQRYKATALYLADADGSDVRLVDRIVASDWLGSASPGLQCWHGVVTRWNPARLLRPGADHPEVESVELQVWTASADGSAPRWSRRCCLADGGSACGHPTAHGSPSKPNLQEISPTTICSSTPTERAPRRRSTSSHTAAGWAAGSGALATGDALAGRVHVSPA